MTSFVNYSLKLAYLNCANSLVSRLDWTCGSRRWHKADDWNPCGLGNLPDLHSINGRPSIFHGQFLRQIWVNLMPKHLATNCKEYLLEKVLPERWACSFYPLYLFLCIFAMCSIEFLEIKKCHLCSNKQNRDLRIPFLAFKNFYNCLRGLLKMSPSRMHIQPVQCLFLAESFFCVWKCWSFNHKIIFCLVLDTVFADLAFKTPISLSNYIIILPSSWS